VAAVSKAVADTSGADAGHVVASGTAGTGGTGVLAGDSDPDTGDSIAVTKVNGSAANVDADVAGTYGTLHLNGDGSYTYTANTALDALQSGSNPTDVFSFTVSDGHGGDVTQNLTFDITGTDDTPVLSADTVQAVPSGWSFDPANGHYYRYVTSSQISWNAADAAATAAGGYLATITDASEDTFVHNLVGSHNAWLGGSDAAHEGTWVWVTGPESGTVFYTNSPQSFPGYSNWNTGEPNNEDHGNGSPHQENYLQILSSGKWNDEQGPNVSSANETDGYVEEMGAPGVVLANFVEDKSTSVATAALLANDTDVDGGALVVSAVNATSAHGGTLKLDSGVITYTPAANFNGADQFSYTVSDGHGGTTSGTLSFNVAAVNDAPVNTVPGAQSVNENAGLVFSGASLITISDVDVLGGTEKVTLSVNHGALTLAGKSGLSFTAGDGTADATMTFTGSVAAVNNALDGLTYRGNTNFHGNDALTITTNDQGNTGSGGAQTDADTVAIRVTQVGSAPAGVAGEPINLGLAAGSANDEAMVTMTVADIPLGWTVNGGALLDDGTWTVQTTDPGSLTVTSPANFTGAMVFNVTETWTQADGSAATATIGDNVEVYSAGSPIFALPGDDFLTASSGKDLLVFSQPIGDDTVYGFAASQDQVDLIGYSGFTSFADIQKHMTEDANGNAVITLADGQLIILQGVHAAALTENNFVFDQTPALDNVGSMMIDDGSVMPLSGAINNTGAIALNSTGDETDLQIIEHGIALRGGGQVILSDSTENVISGTSSDVALTNVDNTISGAGQLGAGQLTLVNEGTIDATGHNSLVVDTGANAVVNSGILEATSSGGLIIHSDVVNMGTLWADGGNVTVDGNVSGNGSAMISGATLEFASGVSSDQTVRFGSGTAVLTIDDPQDFHATIAGLSESDTLDIHGLSANTTATTGDGSYDSATNTTTLTVTDHSDNLVETFKLAGDLSSSTWNVTADHNGGVNIVDPPAPGGQPLSTIVSDPGPAATQTIVATARKISF
jgi:VCBS repeat-containing protein